MKCPAQLHQLRDSEMSWVGAGPSDAQRAIQKIWPKRVIWRGTRKSNGIDLLNKGGRDMTRAPFWPFFLHTPSLCVKQWFIHSMTVPSSLPWRVCNPSSAYTIYPFHSDFGTTWFEWHHESLQTSEDNHSAGLSTCELAGAVGPLQADCGPGPGVEGDNSWNSLEGTSVR